MKKVILGMSLMVILAFSAHAQQHCPANHFRVQPIDGGRALTPMVPGTVSV